FAVDVGAGREVGEGGDDVLGALVVGRAASVVLRGIVVRTASLEIAGDAAGVEAVGEKRGVAETDEQVAPVAKLRGGGVVGRYVGGNGVVGPQASGAVEEEDNRIGAGAVNRGIGQVEPGDESEAFRIVGVT